MLGDAALAPTTVLASQRRPDHAGDAKVGLVKLPSRNQVVDDGFLLGDAVHLGHEPRVVRHTPNVEPRREADEDGTEKIDEICLVWDPSVTGPFFVSTEGRLTWPGSRTGGKSQQRCDPVQPAKEERRGKDARHPRLFRSAHSQKMVTGHSPSSQTSACLGAHMR